LNIWEVALDKYSLAQLWLKEDINNWSLGQVYMHLIHNIINYNFAQIEICISTNRNQSKKKTSDGEKLFEQNLFPNARLKTPPSASGPDQPESLKVVRHGKTQRN